MAAQLSPEALRYERKYLITDYSYQDVQQFLKFHPACFSEIFQQRTINNIYFDTLGMNHYYDNVEGSNDRLKVRIRWYGNLMGTNHNPMLEYKIKHGLLGKKDSYLLNSFTMDSNFNKTLVEQALKNDNVPVYIQHEVLSLKPTLQNSYSRRYFLSGDKKFRITIDSQLTYRSISYFNNTFHNISSDPQTTILELKYDSDFEQEAKVISKDLPFRLTKSSKYLQGIERTLF